MEFNIYNITSKDPNTPLDGLETLEQGLSPGEVKQSLLDRIKTDLEASSDAIHKNLAMFDLSLKNIDITDENNVQEIITDIDNLLYEVLQDDDLDDTIWDFKNKQILIKKTDKD